MPTDASLLRQRIHTHNRTSQYRQLFSIRQTSFSTARPFLTVIRDNRRFIAVRCFIALELVVLTQRVDDNPHCAMEVHVCQHVPNRVGVPFIILVVFLLCVAQASQPQAPPSADAQNGSSQPLPTFHAYTRMVTLEVVVKDRHGNHVTGLKPGDFKLFEQSADEREKRQQAIANFQEIHFQDLVNQSGGQVKVPAGVYTNLVTLQKNPVPPTILLIDGLNTAVKDQAQVQVQMQRILKQIPNDIPVAIFLLGRRLRMLQDFSTDPKLLQIALSRSFSSAASGLVAKDPLDDPNQASAQLEDLAGYSATGNFQQDPVSAQIRTLAEVAKEVEQQQYKTLMDRRVEITAEALTSIGRHVAGYPGRKNLLWVSSDFPIKLNGALLAAKTPRLSGVENRPDQLADDSPTLVDDDSGYASYAAQIQRAANVLSDAKVAVYPINPAGVQPHALFEAGTRPRDYSAQGTADTVSREITTLADEDRSMRVVAEDTGGMVCNGSNDLGECIRKAVDDSSSFYEIAYYPDSQDWNGEYRKIILQSKRSGLHLEYRHGYFAGPNPHENQKAELQDAACEGYLSATAISFAATRIPGTAKDGLRFYLGIVPSALTLMPTTEGGHELNVNVAVCTFDKKGIARQFMSQVVHQTFTAKEYQSIAQNGIPHLVSVPGPQPAEVRFLVTDIPSGRFGSVQVNVEDSIAAVPKVRVQEAPASTAPSEIREQHGATDDNQPRAAESSGTGGLSADRSTSPSSVEQEQKEPKAENLPQYCSKLAGNIQYSPALEKACEFTLAMRGKLPDVICDQQTKRSWSVADSNLSFPTELPGEEKNSDVVTAEVSYRDGHEYYDSVRVNGKLVRDAAPWMLGGAWSSGEFASILSDIFAPSSKSELRYEKEEKLHSVATLVFAYHVLEKNNRKYFIKSGRDTWFPEYSGKFWLDKESLKLRRLERETVYMRKRPITQLRTRVDYNDVSLGDGTELILPTYSEVVVCLPPDGNIGRCSQNVISFANWHKFGAKATIVVNSPN
jgi:VWFA-related protein